MAISYGDKYNSVSINVKIIHCGVNGLKVISNG